MSVYWLIPAQDQLQDALDQSASRTGQTLQELRQSLSNTLETTFNDVESIIVIERINGFSRGMKNHVLRVEYVDKAGESHAAIVKFGAGEQLAQELAGWQQCGRPSNDRGIVLMPLRLGVADADGRPLTIVYEDAKQRLRAARLVNLADAVITCCRWNDPDCATLEHVFAQVFLELRKHLYERACRENEPTKLADSLLPRLQKGIDNWRRPSSQHEDCRQRIMSVLPGGVPDLVDPLDYLPTLLSRRRHLPEVMRGCAHGDLHGRNILVGTDQEKATFAAVFDYEHMGGDRLVGWDFAKLETELKVRAFQQIFPLEEVDFIQAVYEFEQRLGDETLKRNKLPMWDVATNRETPADRLFALLIALRGHARDCLAFEPKRSHSWRHEYYFLLAAYGLYAGRFVDTYGRRQFLSAFLSAAAASAQYAWAKNGSDAILSKSATRAKLAIQGNNPHERPNVADAESFHVPFAFARVFCRSRKSEFVTASTEILKELRTRFPYVLEVWQELALAHLELLDLGGNSDDLDEARRTLGEMEIRFPYRSHVETLSRHGRLWKECGDFNYDRGDIAAAFAEYQKSIDAYRKAYDFAPKKNYYPGINVATLCFLVGQTGQSAQLAREIIENLSRRDPDDLKSEFTWVLATKAEANLLLGNYEDAVFLYEQAVVRPDCLPHYRSAMQKQVKRILRVRPCTGPHFRVERLENVFG